MVQIVLQIKSEKCTFEGNLLHLDLFINNRVKGGKYAWNPFFFHVTVLRFLLLVFHIKSHENHLILGL